MDEPKRIIAGIAATLEIDTTGDRIDPKAMEDAANKFMQSNPILTSGFRNDLVIGKVTSAEVTDRGLEIEAELHKGSPESDRRWEMIKQGTIEGLGIGGKINNKKRNNIVTDITDFDIWDISLVDMPIHESCVLHRTKIAKLELENHHKVVEGL